MLFRLTICFWPRHRLPTVLIKICLTLENDRADHQMSFYAATKKSTESMAHSYAHLFNLPVTMFRFFTVYGPWAGQIWRILNLQNLSMDKKIDVYNDGNMSRDFTYIDDLVSAIRLLVDAIPSHFDDEAESRLSIDSQSPVAPFRLVNIGNSQPEQLSDFIRAIGEVFGD